MESKFDKHENNTDIPFCQIYLPKLLENILKYERLNIFKEIPINFNHNLQMTLESPIRLSNGLLV